ncbi:MAG: helix-turn-helix domain-containing protein [Parvularculaceae bacterium]
MSAPGPVENRFLIIASRTAREAMDVAATGCNVSLAELTAKGRSRAVVAYARQIAMYLAHVVGHMSLTEISAVFERDRTTVAHACHAIEDRRDSEMFDRQIEQLESDLRARLKLVFEKQRIWTAATPLGATLLRRQFGAMERDRRARIARCSGARRRRRSR